jgi:leader peptidase (prepilin peptidase)/N-methyltransferase
MDGRQPKPDHLVSTGADQVVRTGPTRIALVARMAVCVLTVTPLLRWAVIAHAVRSGRPWRRSCPRCATRLGPRGDVHALSPAAQCGRCGQRLGPPPAALEVATALSAAVLVWSGLRGLQLIAYAWWAAIGVVLTFVDLAVQRLPARLSYASASGLVAVLLANALSTGGWQPWVRSVLGALITATVVAVCALALPALVHWGDVRYALAIGAAAAWPGWLTLYTAAFLGTLSAALVGVGLIASRRATLTTRSGPILVCRNDPRAAVAARSQVLKSGDLL